MYVCVFVCACLCYMSVSCFLHWLPYGGIKFILYNLISSKFLPQKLKNGFAACDARWRVHSVTHQTNTGFVRCRTDLSVKVAKLRKQALNRLGIKIRGAAAAAANFFP